MWVNRKGTWVAAIGLVLLAGLPAPAQGLRDAQLFERHHLAALVWKDPTNHWVSSPRLVARWKAVVFKGLQELAR